MIVVTDITYLTGTRLIRYYRLPHIKPIGFSTVGFAPCQVDKGRKPVTDMHQLVVDNAFSF